MRKLSILAVLAIGVAFASPFQNGAKAVDTVVKKAHEMGEGVMKGAKEAQDLEDKVTKPVNRPCCDNPNEVSKVNWKIPIHKGKIAPFDEKDYAEMPFIYEYKTTGKVLPLRLTVKENIIRIDAKGASSVLKYDEKKKKWSVTNTGYLTNLKDGKAFLDNTSAGDINAFRFKTDGKKIGVEKVKVGVDKAHSKHKHWYDWFPKKDFPYSQVVAMDGKHPYYGAYIDINKEVGVKMATKKFDYRCDPVWLPFRGSVGIALKPVSGNVYDLCVYSDREGLGKSRFYHGIDKNKPLNFRHWKTMSQTIDRGWKLTVDYTCLRVIVDR